MRNERRNHKVTPIRKGKEPVLLFRTEATFRFRNKTIPTISQPRTSADWTKLIVKDASVQIIYLDKIIVHAEFLEALADQNGFFLIESPGGTTKLLSNLIHLLELLPKWIVGRIGWVPD